MSGRTSLKDLNGPRHGQDLPEAGAGASTRRAWLVGTGAMALAPLLPACGGGNDFVPETPKPAPEAAAIEWARESIRAAMTVDGSPSAVTVALYRESQVVWQEAFGVLDRDSGQKATPQARVNIGSVSKVFAALATMVLVDRKLVDLDKPLVSYVPEFRMLSPAYSRISVRQCLSHSSGLPGTYFENLFAFKPLPGYAAKAEAAMADLHLKHEPGELAVYCNDGFTMIERLVLAVTGQSFEAFVKTALLDPLEMTESSYPLEPLPDGSFAVPYDREGVRHRQEYVMAYATGGLRSTSGDMMKLATMLIDKGLYKGRRVVSEASIAAMGQDQTLGLRINPSPEWRWGLGWDSVRQLGLGAAGVQAWAKNGGTIFYSTEFFVLPQERMAVFISGNSHGYSPTVLAEGILLRALQGTGRIASVPAALPTQPPAAVTPAQGEVQAVLGIYGNHEAPWKVESVDGARIDLLQGASAPDEPFNWEPRITGLRLRTDGWWWSDVDGAPSYRWIVDGRHRYLMLRVGNANGHYRLTLPLGQQMVPAPAPLPAEWEARLGSVWVLAEEDPSSTALMNGDIPVRLQELPELPGYVFWDNPDGLRQFLLPLSADRAGPTVQVPVNNGRDLMELVFETRQGESWVRAGGSLYRPLRAS